MRPFSVLILLLAGFAGLLLAAATFLPLSIPEILQMAAMRGFESFPMVNWVALIPDSAPFNYFLQVPFLLVFGLTPLGARLDSILFAVGACYFFFRVARRLLTRPVAATLLFALVPLHFELAFIARPLSKLFFF